MAAPQQALPSFQIDMLRYNRRRLTSIIAIGLAIGATGIGVLVLGWILLTLLTHGFAGMSPAVFTEMTKPGGGGGGLANAIVGTLMMVGLATVIGIPIGLLAGTWLAEYARNSMLAKVIRFVNDILLSAPSILIGVFAYQVVVVPMHHFSGLAGTCALIFIALPVVVRTSEDMLRLVPDALREAAVALGCPYWRVVMNICWRSAASGLVTGGLLAIARISGETAPLIFTAFGNQFWSVDLMGPISNLPKVIYDYANLPDADMQALAWAGALLLTMAVLALTIAARSAVRKK